MRPGLLPLLWIAISAAPAARAQSAPPRQPPPPASADVIGSLLEQRGQQAPGDEDEPDTASEPRTAPEPEPTTPQGPLPYTPAPRPQLAAPVRIEETGKTADAPPTPRDMAYDARIRSSFASAEGFQGPLDGGWTLSAGGQDLYALQLVDRRDRLEGVWRDLRRAGALDGSGLLQDIQRQGADLTLRFAGGAVAVLHDNGGSHWTGELTERGRRRPVSLRKSGPY